MKTGAIPPAHCTKFGCIFALLCFTTPAFGLSGGMERAIVHAMRTVPCLASEMAGDGQVLTVGIPETGPLVVDCTEYELRTGKVSYIIRPHHAILLEVGREVSIKLSGKQLVLLTSAAAKEIRCNVLSMTLRSEQEKKEQQEERERERPFGTHYPSGCYSESGLEFSCDENEALR